MSGTQGLFGGGAAGDEEKAKAQDFINRYQTGNPSEGYSEQEAIQQLQAEGQLVRARYFSPKAGAIEAALAGVSMQAGDFALGELSRAMRGKAIVGDVISSWRRLAARVRGSLAQRIHVVAGRVVLAVLCLTSLTALTMSASTLGLVALDAGTEPDVISVTTGQTALQALPGAQLPMLQSLAVRDLRKLNFPDAADPQDTWTVATRQGEGWIDRYSGQTLAWQDLTLAQRLYDWALVLHTGEGAWPWAVVLAFVGASVLLFWWSGVVMWWQARRQAPHITGNSPLAQADVLIFVASEGGSTWGFAQALQDALTQSGHRVHTSALENFQTTPATRQVFVLAATYGEGQAPAHAKDALERMAKLSASAVPVTVLGFGDRQYPAFCAFAVRKSTVCFGSDGVLARIHRYDVSGPLTSAY